MLVDYLRNSLSFPDFVSNFSGFLCFGVTSSIKLYLFKPMTFMNNSGFPLARLVNFYKVHPCNVLVFHDDADLGFGRIKIKKGGSSGGHNGLKSIDSNLGRDYWRFRFGVGKEENSNLAKYVLSSFTECEIGHLNKVFEFIAKNIILLLSDIERQKSTFLMDYMSVLNTI
ncbi:peptidyl-tRNA hydrolase family protein [Neorickettsia helminthoeca str. Oregon]|uniref:Peptidyl-tRNA hydrolase n=2 Tax=Neorickettsia helminthoeca TaxID=33994 RepID=X5H3H4_9RICK|nr:peptidyl-tRNA hydrolase family protein [Neorickettsia helminthoeca str. Oregon]